MELFNKPWMNNINPDLLIRYWRKKGSSEPIAIEKYGIRFVYEKTIFGEFVTIMRWKERILELHPDEKALAPFMEMIDSSKIEQSMATKDLP